MQQPSTCGQKPKPVLARQRQRFHFERAAPTPAPRLARPPPPGAARRGTAEAEALPAPGLGCVLTSFLPRVTHRQNESPGCSGPRDHAVRSRGKPPGHTKAGSARGREKPPACLCEAESSAATPGPAASRAMSHPGILHKDAEAGKRPRTVHPNKWTTHPLHRGLPLPPPRPREHREATGIFSHASPRGRLGPPPPQRPPPPARAPEASPADREGRSRSPRPPRRCPRVSL